MTIIEALADRRLFGGVRAFQDLTTWKAWCVFLAATYGLPLSSLEIVGISEDNALALFLKHTGRSTYAPPVGGHPEAVAIIGRQAGKDRIAGVIQGYEAMTATPDPDGLDLYSLTICQDARSSLRTQFAYARAPFERVALLKSLVTSGTADTLKLRTGVVLAAYPCRPQAVRGVRARCVICSELAFFRSSEGDPVDAEMLRAVRPTLATTGGKLIILSSPHAEQGALFELHRKHWGRDESTTLIWQASAPDMNPTLPADYLARMEADDPDAFRSEVLGEFRPGITQLIDPSALLDCVASGVREIAPVAGRRYIAHTDASSGTGKDAWGLGIAHLEGDRAVLDVSRAWKPKFNPSSVVGEIATLLRAYNLKEVHGDKYAPGFVSEAFRAAGIDYRYSDRDTSTIFLDIVPVINTGGVILLDDEELIRELRGLERRRGQGGRDRAGHRPGGHDDRAVAAAGAITRARKPAETVIAVIPGPDSSWQDSYFTGRGRTSARPRTKTTADDAMARLKAEKSEATLRGMEEGERIAREKRPEDRNPWVPNW